MVKQYRCYAITDFKLLRNCWSTFELTENSFFRLCLFYAG